MILTIILYLVIVTGSVGFASFFIDTTAEGGFNNWYDRKVLFPMREKGWKIETALGGCEQCFSIWVGTIWGTVFCAYQIGLSWWLLSLPTFISHSMGFSSIIFKFIKNLTQHEEVQK